jgi:hypothetical protein
VIGVRQFLGAGAALAAGWLCKESYRGNAYKWRERFVAEDTHNQYKMTEYGWGQWSGQPTMDKWSHKLFGIKVFGLFGSRADYLLARAYVEGFVNDVLLRNMAPIAVGIGGLYAAFGNNLAKPFQATYRYMTGPGASILKPIASGTAELGKFMAKGSLKAGEFGMNQLIKGGFGSAALLGVLSFGLLRFWRVNNGQEQVEYHRQFAALNHPYDNP